MSIKIAHNNWHFARPQLADAYLNSFELGLSSARGLFARRRMGKTEFLKQDLIPAAQTKGYVCVYVNLWEIQTDPAISLLAAIHSALSPRGISKMWNNLSAPLKKIKASAKMAGIEGSLEAELNEAKQQAGSLLVEAMALFDAGKANMLLIIDEAQVLADPQHSIFTHALRAALDIRKERIKVVFAGSSESTLRRMFGVSSEPFYNWAPLEPFPLLGDEFIKAMVKKVATISKFPLPLPDALNAFEELNRTPEFFRRYLDNYLTNPLPGAQHALEHTKNLLFNDDGFITQWNELLATDQYLLLQIAHDNTDMYSAKALLQLGQQLGLDKPASKSTVQNALTRLAKKNIVTKMERNYQFEDIAFAEWLKKSDFFD
ncbi:hypothetical protein [Solimicrobium silvestre]|uniref:Archaeal ATPase n=1 Tax=Solimicrobium silvestre TaxID=2099400 RepID=A0A2S9GXE2_9BURK|nr:hypothetical protein [Solimicrobium silvestre]PRC92389.1 Archaeal ATPase [Solimicrobium silvestre]